MLNCLLRFQVMKGSHHVTPDEQGRLVIQGLLTATLPTKIGGDNNVLARTMNFEFLRPVFTGDTIICEVTIEKFERQDYRISIWHLSYAQIRTRNKY